MADATIIAVAKSVANDILAHDWGQEIGTAEWSFADFDEALEDLTETRVDVVPVHHDKLTVVSRKPGVKWDFNLEVGIRKTIEGKSADVLGQRDKEEAALLVKLYEDMLEFFSGRPITGVSEEVAFSPKPIVTFDPDLLRRVGLFVAVFQLNVIGFKRAVVVP